MKTDKIIKTLSELPLFDKVEQGYIKKIAQAVKVKNIDKGKMLFQMGDLCEGFYQIVSGKVKLSMISKQGNEKIVEIIREGQCFGEAVMFSGKPYPVHAWAVVDSKLLYIPKKEIFDLIDNDSYFVRKVLSGMSFRVHVLMKEIENISFRGSFARVADYLLQNSSFEVNCESGHNSINTYGMPHVELKISKKMLASKLNITPETLSRIFANLINNGVITVNKKNIIIIDQKHLTEIDNSGY